MVSYYDITQNVNKDLDKFFKDVRGGHIILPIPVNVLVYELTLKYPISEKYVRSRVSFMCSMSDEYMISEDRVIKVPVKKLKKDDVVFSKE